VALERVVTIGAYGFTADSFFAALRDAGVDTFLDIRQRRGVRGAEYAFANHGRLTASLETMGIRYLHELGLAPTTEIRTAQYAVDAAEGVSKRQRESLSPAFIEAYQREILAPFDLPAMLDSLPAETRVLALFCVERTPEACHRHLVADAIHDLTGVPVQHLMP
jgi:uncharacterized protein (DUF488 family)